MTASPRPSRPEFSDARVMVIVDDDSSAPMLERLLRQWGYASVVCTAEASDAPALCTQFRPDLILLDQELSEGGGFELLERLGTLVGDGSLPIILLSSEIGDEAKQRALASGAKDFIMKPIRPLDAGLRVRNALEARRLYREVSAHTRVLEERIRLRTHELEVARLEFVQRLALAAEYRDVDGPEHAQRVGRGAAALALALRLPEADVHLIRAVAPLHDIGNIGIPDVVLLRPGKLAHDEFELMKTHTVIGTKILSGGRSRHLRMAEQIARSHHERWDGAGYPDGLVGDAIPLAARLTAVADVFDALTHRRPHKEPWPLADAVAEIERQGGAQFDPDVVRAFRALDHEALLAPVKPILPSPSNGLQGSTEGGAERRSNGA